MIRTYSIPMTGVVTVDPESGDVTVEVDLTAVANDLKLDYDHLYPNEFTDEDAGTITARLMDSPTNFSMKHTMKGAS